MKFVITNKISNNSRIDEIIQAPLIFRTVRCPGPIPTKIFKISLCIFIYLPYISWKLYNGLG